MVAEKEIRWLPWRFRLSAKAQDENLMIRPKKLPRLQELGDLLLDEAPTRDIHDGPASYNMINQLLTHPRYEQCCIVPGCPLRSFEDVPKALSATLLHEI